MIADLHNDLPSRLLREKINGKIPDIDKIMSEDYGAENLALVVFAVFVPTDVVLRKNDALYALAQLLCLKDAVIRSKKFVFVTKNSDIDGIISQGKTAVFISLEGAEPIARFADIMRKTAFSCKNVLEHGFTYKFISEAFDRYKGFFCRNRIIERRNISSGDYCKQNKNIEKFIKYNKNIFAGKNISYKIKSGHFVRKKFPVADRKKHFHFNEVYLSFTAKAKKEGEILKNIITEYSGILCNNCACDNYIKKIKSTAENSGFGNYLNERYSYDGYALEFFHNLGVDVLGLVWSRKNSFAGGSRLFASPTEYSSGLSCRGRNLLPVAEMLDMIIDLSHSSDKTFVQTLDNFYGKVMLSHTNCRFLCNVERNASDEQLRAVGERNGIIGINGVSFLLKNPLDKSSKKDNRESKNFYKTKDDYFENNPCEGNTWDKIDFSEHKRAFVRHCVHAIKTAGADCVAFGLDISDSRAESGKCDVYRTEDGEITAVDATGRYSDITEINELMCSKGLDKDNISLLCLNNAKKFFKKLHKN